VKKIFLLFGFITFATLLTQAQVTDAEPGDKIRSLEIAYLTKQLQLMPDEAEKFWPVFNQYRKEMKFVMNDATISDELDRDQKALDVRKKYRKSFTAILGVERGQRVYEAEDRFKALVRKEVINRRKARMERAEQFRKNK
jgi:hypothetical protein